MEAERENEENLIIFWETLNSMLADHLNKPDYKFNPKGYCCDENHANFTSIKKVNGEQAAEKVSSCEYHFQESVKRHSKKLDSEQDLFEKLANDLLKALTLTEFNAAVQEMTSFVARHPNLRCVCRTIQLNLGYQGARAGSLMTSSYVGPSETLAHPICQK